MRVLMFGWEFPPHISGGLGTACYGIAAALVKEGVQLTFVVPRLHGGEHAEAIDLIDANDILVNISESTIRKWHEKFEYISVASTLMPYTSAEDTSIFSETLEQVKKTAGQKSRYAFSGKYGKNLLEEVHRYALVASKISSNTDYDLIHAHDWLTFPAGIAAKKSSGKPLIVHVHATEYDRSGEVNQNIYGIEKEGMDQADQVIAVSEYTRQLIISKYKIAPEKVTVAHNGIIPKGSDESMQLKNFPERVVTFMGRITHQKGPEYFVEAANKVLQKNLNVRFVMAGNGDMMIKMMERVAALKMSSRFHFTGFLKGPDVKRMYAMSDVFVMPSVSEPFGIAPLEAMQANVPVIISKQSGVSEVLKHAIKIDFWNTDALADAISGLVRYKTLSKLFKENGKHEILKVKWEKTGEQIISVYNKLLKKVSV